jgi:hypothetical protein
VVSDLSGTTPSQSAYLTVLSMPPSIVTQPASQTVPAGAAVTLFVTADGSPPLNYQWFQNNTNLSDRGVFTGSATSALTIANVSAAQTGGYFVTVSNTSGTATSQTAIVALIGPSYIAYSNAGAVYAQTFDSLPDPGSTTDNATNPVTINGVTYSLPDPFDFAYPVSATGDGGLGLTTSMAGWYGWGAEAAKFGASAGDQTTGGIISFGPTTSAGTNRSLGLLATGTTDATAFGARILNQTGEVLTNMSLAFTAELWRQQTSPKTISVSYYVDLTGSSVFSPGSITGVLSNLAISFATGTKASGTSGPLMISTLGVSNQPMTNCPPGAALWLIWQMASNADSSQGLGIDNLTFSATGTPPPSLTIAQSNAVVLISWPAWAAGYVLQYNDAGLAPNQWFNLNSTVLTSNQWNTVNVPITITSQFFRLRY